MVKSLLGYEMIVSLCHLNHVLATLSPNPLPTIHDDVDLTSFPWPDHDRVFAYSHVLVQEMHSYVQIAQPDLNRVG